MSDEISKSIDAVFTDKCYLGEVRGELKAYDNPEKANAVYEAFVKDYTVFLKERNSSFRQAVKDLAPIIQSPVIQILKATRKHAKLDERLSKLLEGMESATHGVAGTAVNRGPRDDPEDDKVYELPSEPARDLGETPQEPSNDQQEEQ